MITNVADAIAVLQDKCDKVYDRLVDDQSSKPASFKVELDCDLETAAYSPNRSVVSCPLASFTCVKTKTRHPADQRFGLPTVVVYTVEVREHSSTRDGVES